jgi:hypothetical protein
MFSRLWIVAALLLSPIANAWEESFSAVSKNWDEQQVLNFILARSPILKAYRTVTTEYTPSKPMQRVLEHTSVFARLSPAEIGSTQTTTDGNFLASAGSTVGVQLSIPLASRKEEREHALKALDEIKAVEQLRTAVLQDWGCSGSMGRTIRLRSYALHSGRTRAVGRSNGSPRATTM